MFEPESKSSKYLVAFPGSAEINLQSLKASNILRDNAPGRVKIRWNHRTGVSQSVRGILTEPREGTGRKIADQFLAENGGLFGISEDTSDLHFVEMEARRGVQHVKYQQRY